MPPLLLFQLRRLKRPGPRLIIPVPTGQYPRVYGTVKDVTGAPIGGATMKLYATATDTLLQTVTAGSTGDYEFRLATGGGQATYYVVAYKAGSPDLSGTTVNTLTST